MNFTCKGCGDRKPGCHITCKLYIHAKRDYEAKKAEIARKRQEENQANQVKIEGVTRSSRYGGR